MNYGLINREALRAGDIISRSTPEFGSKVIMLATKAAWSHDAILIPRLERWYVGDALLRAGCQLTPLEDWEHSCLVKGHRIIITRPAFATQQQGEMAAKWWADHVMGKDYDRVAIWRLGLKIIFGDWLSGKVGLEEDFYCTEGVKDAWHKGACLDPWWPKVNPTPGTSTKRTIEGRLKEVVDALTEKGLQYRVAIETGTVPT